MRAAFTRFALRRVAYRELRDPRRLSSYRDCPARHAHIIPFTRAQEPPYKDRIPDSQSCQQEDWFTDGIFLQESVGEDIMDDAISTSTTSSGKRKRGAPAYYAVKEGHEPGIYYSWEDAKKQVHGYKNPTFVKFGSLQEAEDFMKGNSYATAKPGKTKYYGVRFGHKPGVYTDYKSVLEQVTGFKGGKQKKFETFEEAQAYVEEGKGATPSEIGTPISLKGHLDTAAPSVASVTKTSKKQKKNDGSAAIAETNGEFEPGTGPLPLDAEDGFDRTIKLNPTTGAIEYKTEAELNARKLQPTGEFDGPLIIYTDGSSLGNGQIGAVAGVGVWFGPNDPRNVSEGLTGEGKQTNQRAELTAISRAIDIAPIDRSVLIYTDSYYSIKCCTEWFQKWEKNEWKNSAGKPVENKDLVEPIIARIRERELAKATTKFAWLKGHAGKAGNTEADVLAVQGAKQAQIERRAQASTPVVGEENAHALALHGAQEGQDQINTILNEE